MRFAPIQYEAFNETTGAVVGVFPTLRRASNAAIAASSVDGEKGGTFFARRMRPMHANDVLGLTAFRYPGNRMARLYRELQASGFWQPTGYDKYTGRYQYLA